MRILTIDRETGEDIVHGLARQNPVDGDADGIFFTKIFYGRIDLFGGVT